MLKYIRTCLFILIAVAIVYSCRDESCMESMTSNVNIQFYKSKNSTDSLNYLFSAYGVGRSDSMIYDSTNLTIFGLPLDQNSDQSKFFLTILTLVDTIHVPDSIAKDTIISEPIPDTIKIYKPSFKVKNIYKFSDEILTVNYKRQLEMVSPECGFTNNIVLDTIWSTKNTIDSIFIRKTGIDRGSNEENVQIFL